jgi:hypothetical protein
MEEEKESSWKLAPQMWSVNFIVDLTPPKHIR